MNYDRSMPSRHRSPRPVPTRVDSPLDIEQLRRFLAVARMRGFTAAARSLRIAQPAISRSVRALEEDVGGRLIERTSRHFALTPLGERLAEECVVLFERVDALRALVAEPEVDMRGALRVGASEPVAAALL